MTDNKQIAKDKFRDIAKTDIDAMFDRTLSQDEVDVAVMKEVGTVLGEMKVINEVVAEVVSETNESLDNVGKIEKGIDDLKKLNDLREDLQKAA
jgi:hypothetical protein